MLIFENDNCKITALNNNEIMKTYKKKTNLSEIDILKKLHNEYIINLVDIVHDNFNISIKLERGERDLFDMIENNFINPSNENYIKYIMFNLLEGLSYIHSNNIIHNDIKPENIIYRNRKFCITDFGLSIYDNKIFTDLIPPVGNYVDPTLYLKIEPMNKYNDIWSLGIVFYAIVKARYPYIPSDNIDDIINQLNDSLETIENNFYKQIISDMLNIKKRLTCNQILEKFFNNMNPILYQKIDDFVIINYTNVNDIFCDEYIHYSEYYEKWLIIATLDLFNLLLEKNFMKLTDEKWYLKRIKNAIKYILCNFVFMDIGIPDIKLQKCIIEILEFLDFNIYRRNVFNEMVDKNLLVNFQSFYNFIITEDYSGSLIGIITKFYDRSL